MTSYERRVTSEEPSPQPSPTGRGGLSPAMEGWRRKLAAGYTIPPRLRVGGRGYVEWGPALHNPEGAFVQNMRRDTLRKLMRLGVLSDEQRATGDELGSGGRGVDEGNADVDASAAGDGGDGGVGGDSE